jgi:enamine deaminase RidA (YjgF/YER057c/UK114 family)
MPTPSEALAALGLTLPPVVAPLAAYVPAVRTGSLVYTSGQLPMLDGRLHATGTVGAEVSAEVAQECARLCALNALAAVADLLGAGGTGAGGAGVAGSGLDGSGLDAVRRVVKVVGFVASAPGFTGQPTVVNGASELLRAVFGDAGAHARSAVGVAALPLGAPVEVELIVEVAG